MCGIVGGITHQNICPILLDGLKLLEYRGYDSAGIALLTKNKELVRKRIVGKVDELCKELDEHAITGFCGIAHTRWATHGVPSEANAHPHVSHDMIALVHNGIIENHQPLRARLTQQGYQFTSTTDSEVIVHLIHSNLDDQDLLSAVKKTLKELKGMYALAIISRAEPDSIVVARYGSPLVIGLGKDENYIASDILALSNIADRFCYLEDGDIAVIKKTAIKIMNSKGETVDRTIHKLESTVETADKQNFNHYMEKEILEQPKAIANVLKNRLTEKSVISDIFGKGSEEILKKIEAVTLVACGTSYYAAMEGKYWLEEIAGISSHVEIASEYRYRHPVIKPNSLFVVLSQSGETADTLAAFRLAKKQGYLASLAICNVAQSTLVREAELFLLTHAGPEICVASTKAFTTQLAALLMLTALIGRHRKLTEKKEAQLVAALQDLPAVLDKILSVDEQIKKIANKLAYKQHALFLGRESLFPVALEGALKLKEITYIHAEAYPAGELKHGPLALVDKDMPVIVVAPQNNLYEKIKSNLEEVRARGGDLIVLSDNMKELSHEDDVTLIEMPSVDKLVEPIVYTLPLQLLAYYVGVIKGTNVDQPRNLAKAVTVE